MSGEAQHFISLLSPYIRAYGYWVAFFGMMLENAGIPVPAESALIVLAFFAGQGVLKIWLVIPIAILGDVIGDNMGFFIGRLGGRRLVERYGRYVRIDKQKLDAMDALFREKGGRTVFTAHFFATTRITAALTAGISHMPYPRFLKFNVAAAATFVTLVALVTYHFGKNLDATLRFFHLFRLTGLVIVTLIVTIYLYRYWQREKDRREKLGLKIIMAATTGAVLFGLAVYTISGALILLPRAGKSAGLTEAAINRVPVTVKQGFISDIGPRSVLITALGDPQIVFGPGGKQQSVNQVTVRNIWARRTDVVGRQLAGRPLALDDLTLNFAVAVKQGVNSKIILEPKPAADRFGFAVIGDTRDSGPIFGQIVASINRDAPDFVVGAGDLVKDGEKRQYRTLLDTVAALKAPLYTALGAHELRDGGGPRYRRLFGPGNYVVTHQKSALIILDTSDGSINDNEFFWLSRQLAAARRARSIFLATYTAPTWSKRFTDLLARGKVQAVFAVRAGKSRPGRSLRVKGVRYEFLEHQPGSKYFYVRVGVTGARVTERAVTITPKGLTLLDRLILALEELKRRLF